MLVCPSEDFLAEGLARKTTLHLNLVGLFLKCLHSSTATFKMLVRLLTCDYLHCYF